ncbi:SDR family NAD(P)-dependent oxidoreductase [Oceanibacterium hippocampi]|uniref:Putative oxidoreductase n=1 Tax=Oceanibacterium hippocampi TaxID=745714 RepID=A0A1Y5S963_9PROT|nr:SDR family NAD(P)-dependent oxidoreductase [Oceanibacterium hippocampi]SLN35352.1 putative oxidoreductase [Oceanibacterium hippocampi]
MAKETALIVGAGPGLGAALARRFAAGGLIPVIASRTEAKVKDIAAGIDGARAFACDGTDEEAVTALVGRVEGEIGPIRVAVHNASGRYRSPIAELPAEEYRKAWEASALGGFLLGREAARVMLPRKQGTILFTGATASVKSFAQSAAFAGGKFALRALAQSMARELHPQGIHVAHVVIDGGIGVDEGGARLEPDAIAEAYWQLHCQDRSAWSQEIELRPWVEKF